MSVVTRNPDGSLRMPGSPTGRQMGPLQQAPEEPSRPELQRQAVIDQLGTSPAAAPAPPTASAGGAFARGGQVKQLPGAGLGETVGNMAGSTAINMAGRHLGNQAANAASSAAGGAATSGIKSALTSGAGGAAAGAGISLATGMLANKVKKREEMPEFGGDHGDLTDHLGRRMEGTGGGTHYNMIKYAGMASNPALVAATLGIAPAAGAAFGAIKAAVTRNAPSAFTDFSVEDAAEAINAGYQKYLGRPASEEEIKANLVGQGWNPDDGSRWVGEKGLRGQGGVLDQIRDSPEAQAFRARGSVIDQLGTGGEPTVETSVPAGATREGGISGASGALSPGNPGSGGAPEPGNAARGGGGGRLEGFGGMTADGRSKLEASDSPKYQVARVLQNYPSTPEGLRQALPELQKLGLGDVSIGGSKGDKLTFSGQTDPRFNGVTTFDVIRAAGKGGEAWVWQGEDGAPAPAAGAPNAAGSVDLGSRAPQPDVLDGDMLARLRAELERIMSGTPDRNALLAQMGGANG